MERSDVAVALRSGRLKPSTLDSYRDVVERHITPVLGKEPLGKLTPAKVRSWISAKQTEIGVRGKPLSSRTVAYYHAVLRKALADAVRDELVGRNVAALVEPPLVRRTPVQPLTADEARKLLETAAHDRLRVLWLVILGVGLRRGEALGLRWDDVDLEAGTLTVRRSLQRLRGERDQTTGRRKGQLREVAPKTEGSAATIALPGSVVTALRGHVEVQAARADGRDACGSTTGSCSRRVSAPRSSPATSTARGRLCASRAGVRKVRIHDLRHSAASFMLAAGVDLKLIQTTLRHSRLATTADVYAHVLDEVQHQAAARMDGVLRGLAG